MNMKNTFRAEGKRLCGVAAIYIGTLGLVAGCSESELKANVEWKVSCNTANQVGPCNYLGRRFSGGDGSDDHQVSCRAEKRDGDRAAVYFSVFHGGDYGLELRQALVPKDGGAVDPGGCQLRVQEDSDYVATCGSGAPVTNQPCSFSAINIDGSTVSGTFVCRGLPSNADALALRDVTGPNGQGEATFRFENCDVF